MMRCGWMRLALALGLVLVPGALWAASGPGTPGGAPALVQALRARDAGARWDAAVALGRLGPAAVPALTKALADDDERVRAGAALALGRIGPPAEPAVPQLTAALRDSAASVREQAAEALGAIGPAARGAESALVATLADADPYVIGKAAAALAALGKETVPALVTALADPRVDVRRGAAIALAKIGPDAGAAVPDLARALADSDENVRRDAATALGTMGAGAQSAIPALVECLHDRDENVRRAATLALSTVDPSNRGRDRSREAVVATIERLTPQLMDELHVPGVSIALIVDRKIAWTRSFGVADARTKEPVTARTLFEAASMSKPVFAYVALQLSEENRLDLDRPLVSYLPEKFVPDQPERRAITARMVLSHTSGLPNWRPGGEERDGPVALSFDPGFRFGYSGEGMYYLQRVVEHVAGEPLDIRAKRTLFDPLGLAGTSFAWTPDIDARIASGHDASGRFLQKTKYTHPNAAYSLYTTAEEYAKFVVAVMSGPDPARRGALTKGTLDMMLTHHVRADAREPIERPGAARGRAVFWGLGWSINVTGQGDIVHHGGANSSGFRCFSQFSPSRGTGLVIMTNGTAGDALWTRLVATIGDL